MFALKPFKEIIRMTSDAIDDMLAGVREWHFKAKVDVKLAELDV